MSEEDLNQEFVNMLWKWFEDRGVDLRPERSEGLTAEDFRIMLDEHEIALDRSDELRALLIDAPILLIDRSVAKLLDENVALEYADAVAAWHKRVSAALADQQTGSEKQ